jgi:hypothetical protein
MMQVSAIVSQIDKSFETNDSNLACSRIIAIDFFFSLLKATYFIRNFSNFFFDCTVENGKFFRATISKYDPSTIQVVSKSYPSTTPSHGSTPSVAGWLAGWLAGCLPACLPACLPGWLPGWLAGS